LNRKTHVFGGLPKVHYVLGFANPTKLQDRLPPIFLPSKVTCVLWVML
jgi:hypothetical protein